MNKEIKYILYLSLHSRLKSIIKMTYVRKNRNR